MTISLVLSSACGSTALRHGAAAPASPALGGGTLGGSAPEAEEPPLSASAPAVSTSPQAAAVGAGPGEARAQLPAARPNTAVTVPSLTVATSSAVNTGPKVAPKAPIRLGVVGVDASAIAGQFGKTAPPDTFAGIKSMIRYLNAHDGIAGHQIKTVYVRLDSGADVAQSGQLACTVLTQDNDVDMVLSLGFASDTLYGCLKQKSISLFGPAGWAPDAQWLAQYPNVFLPDAMTADRYTAAEITSAVQRGALRSGDRIGVLTESCPWGDRIYDNVIVPTARKYGVTTRKAPIKCITNLVADLGPITQDLSRAALQFATNGATHVMGLSAAEGFFDAVFSQVASAQHYLPKYLVSSNVNAYNTTNPKGVVHFSSDAMPNLIGLGFQPLADVGPKAQPANAAQGARQAECRKTDPNLGGAATDTTDERSFKLNVFYMTCDALYAIKDILTSNGNRFGLIDMAAGYRALLDRGVSAVAAGGRYGGGGFRHDGLGLAVPFGYNSAIARTAVVGGLLAVP